MPPSSNLRAEWSPVPPLLIFLALIIFVRLGIPFVAPSIRVWSQEFTLMAGVLTLFMIRRSTGKPVSPQLLPFPLSKKEWWTGLILGILTVAAPMLTDLLISSTPLSDSPLFAGASGRIQDARPIGGLELFRTFLIEPFLGQIVILGIILAPLRGKLRQELFVIIGGLLFVLALWNFSLAGFLVGVISAFLLHWTGSLFPGLIFQMLSGLSGILMLHAYPRSTTLLGFLFQGII